MSGISSLQGHLLSGLVSGTGLATIAAGTTLLYLAAKKVFNSPVLVSSGVALVGKVSSYVLPANKHDSLSASMQEIIPNGSTIASTYSAAENYWNSIPPRQKDAETLLVNQIETLNPSEPINSTQPDDNCDFLPLIEQEKNTFVRNTTNFLLLKHLYERTIGKAADDQFYKTILYQAKTQPNPDNYIKESFFKLLKDAKINVFKRFFIRIQWLLFSKVINYAIKNAYDSHVKEALEYIDKNQATNFSNLKNLLIENTGRTLTVMNSIYDKLPSKPATNTIPKMLDQEISKPENNLGTSAEQLHSKFIKIELTKSLGWFLAFLAQPFLSGAIIDNLINTSSSSVLNTDGYAHALNTVLVQELEKVFQKLQDHKTKEKDLTLTNSLSAQNKHELTGLVKSLLEILPKSQASTLEELRETVNNSSWKSKIDAAVSPFLIDPIIEETVKLIEVVAGSFAHKNSLNKIVWNLITLANQSFDPNVILSPQAYKNKEEELDHITDKIIKLAINEVIDNGLDIWLSNDPKKNLTNKTIQTLREETTKYTTFLENKINFLRLSNPNTQDDQTLQEDRVKLEALKKETAFYKQKNCLDVLRKAKESHQLDDTNKAALEERLLKAAEISIPLVDSLDEAWKISNEIEKARISRSLLQGIRLRLDGISDKLYLNPNSPQHIEDCKASVIEIGKELELLQQEEFPSASLMKNGIELLSQEIIAYDNINSLIAFQKEQYKTANLIDAIVQQKKEFLKEKKSFFCFFGAQKKDSHSEKTIITLSNRIQSLPHTNLKITLSHILDNFRNCKSEEAVNNLKASYFTALDTEINSQAETITVIKTNIKTKCAITALSIAESNLISNPNVIPEKRLQIQDLLKKASTTLEAIKSWNTPITTLETCLGKFPFVNLNSHKLTDFQYPLKASHLVLWAIQNIPVKNKIKDVLFNAIKTRLDSLKHLIQQPTTVKFGLHHLVLHPYVKWTADKDK